VAELERLRKEEQRRIAEERKKQQYRADGAKIDNGDGTITDYATGLMWQKSGAATRLNYREAEEYIQELNQIKFAGYSDWLMPTTEELKSLLTQKTQSNNLYIDPIFDSLISYCWTCSIDPKDSSPVGILYRRVGIVSFEYPKGISYDTTNHAKYIRAVRNA